MTLIDATILTTALDAWERDPASYDVTPFYALSAAHPTEASYLWQIARGARPPSMLVDEALRNLLAWGLVDDAGIVTPLGRRLIEHRRTSANSATRGAAPSAAVSASAARLSDRALHLLREIAAGRDRVFAADERPPGWSSIDRLGLATRAAGDRARLTQDGEEFVRGVEAGQGEVLEGGWTRENAQMYLAQVGAPTSVFDAGHQSGIRAAVGLNRRASGQRRPPIARQLVPRSTGARPRRERLTPAKVIADLKKATGLDASILTRRTRRSGFTVRKHSPSLVYVAYDDYGDRNDQPRVWPTVLSALERAGYTLEMADGRIGADAKAQALQSGAVLVSRRAPSGPREAETERARSSSNAPASPKGTWAWTEDARVFVPDVRVTPRPTDERVPLRGYGFVDAIRRDGKIIGYAERS